MASPAFAQTGATPAPDAPQAYKVPLGNDPQNYVSIGGELRERFEYYSSPDFGLLGGGADAYLLHRLLLYSDLHWGDIFRTFIQLGSFFAPDKDHVSGVYADHLDLQQGFADIRLPISPEAQINPILRVGRQEMAFGSQRLVAIRDVPNVPRTFDGVRLSDTIGDTRIDGFVTRPVLLETGVFDDHPDHEQAFWGAYSTTPVPLIPGLSADLFYLGFDNEEARYVAGSGHEHRHTIGMRLFGTAASIDWDWEALGQFGTFDQRDIRALGVSTDTGYTLRNARWSPRAGLKADFGSGDHNPRGGTLGTINALFPKLGYFNQAALLYPANIIDVQPSLSIKPTNNLTASLGWDFAWRATTQDAVWVAPFTPFPGTAGRGGRFIGNQLALDIAWRIGRHWEIDASYVHFSVGSALRVGGGRDVDFAMFSTAYRF